MQAIIVADTNVISNLYIPGEYTSKADAAFFKDSNWWVVPFIWKSEFRNVLALYLQPCIFTKKMPLEHALNLVVEAESLMAGNEHQVSSSRIHRGLAAAA